MTNDPKSQTAEDVSAAEMTPDPSLGATASPQNSPPKSGHVSMVHAYVRNAILRGDMEPGDEVRQERIAGSLNVSRTPLREALRLLEREGLVESAAHRSYRVTGFSVQDIEEIYVARLSLEVIGIRLTIPQMKTEDFAALAGSIAQMNMFASAADYDQWEAPHRAFHARLYAGAGTRITRLLSDLSDHSRRYRRFRTLEAPLAWSAGDRDHRSILDACMSGDSNEGARRLARHLYHTAEDVIQLADPGYKSVALDTAIKVAEAQIEP